MKIEIMNYRKHLSNFSILGWWIGYTAMFVYLKHTGLSEKHVWNIMGLGICLGLLGFLRGYNSKQIKGL